MKQPIVFTRIEKLSFRKEEFDIVYHYCVDDEDHYEFTTTEVDELNLTQLYNKYRAKYKLPFPDDVKNIRAKYGVSASKMSEILGFGTNIYRNYESGEIPNESNARLIQLIDDPQEFKKLLNLKKDVLKYEEYDRILSKVEKLVPIEDSNFNKNARTIYNGFQKFDRHKFANMLVYFADKMSPYKTKLNKLFFYADFYHYKKTGFSISGAIYRAIQFGPVPNDYDTLYQDVIKNEKIEYVVTENDIYTSEQFLLIKSKPFEAQYFTEQEIETLTIISQKFKKITAKKIADLSHEELAWLDNEKNKGLINFDYAFGLKGV
jgi:DNA-binding transcriptional regulator YiaG/uncharacterized phage-associated protein